MGSFNSRDIIFGQYFDAVSHLDLPFSEDSGEDAILIELCEAVREQLPDDIFNLQILGHLYTETGDFASGLSVDRKLCELVPDDSHAWYNLACSYALMMQLQEAIEALEKAIGLGYDDIEHLSTDEDLDNIRETDEYRDLVSRMLFREQK
jgi:tetratricopeptide (TPR) repeat protein